MAQPTILCAGESPGRDSALAAADLVWTDERSGVMAAFSSARDALAVKLPGAAVAIHTGDAHRDGDRFAGSGVARCRRLHELARPGQTLVSAPAAAAAGATLQDAGLRRLRDLSPPVRVFVAGDSTVALGPLDVSEHNLPERPTSFVGREAELAELHVRLAGTRLLTVAGPGGSGKSRLAAQLAAEQAGGWPDGVWWAALGDVADPVRVPAVVAAAVGALVVPAQGAAASLKAQLAGRRLLLCLDCCEHVLAAAAELAAGLCADCPGVTIVATSREPFGLSGEAVWRLPPLSADDARALFLERAGAPEGEDAAIAAMCTRLDGSPLALELAAAWAPLLTPGQIEAGLDDRFALLVRSPRDAVPRQSSLLASMAWSHDLLDDTERAVFRRLAVFSGGFDLAAAQDVCDIGAGAALEAIAGLVDKSLVVAQDARYRLPETIRQYAADRLRAAGERVATADRHLDHMLARAQAAAPDRDRDKDRWRAALAPEHDNLRAAIEHGLQAADPTRGRLLAAELPWLWHLHRQGREGMDVLRRAIARAPDERSPLQAQLLAGEALVADTADPLDVEVQAAERAAELAAEHGDERLLAMCVALAAVGRLYTDLDAAYETSLRADALAGDAFVRDAGRALRGIVLHLRDEHAAARELLSAAADGLAARGDRGVASTALAFLSGSARLTGERAQARELAERSIAVAAPLADHLRIGMGRSALALALGAAGDVPAGLDALAPLLPLVAAADGAPFLPDVNRALGTLRLWAGDPEAALGPLAAEAASSDGGRPTFLAVRALPALAAAQRRTGAVDDARATVARAVELAREREMPAVLADALSEQARLEPAAALDLHHQALALRADHSLRPGMAESLQALAALSPPEQAARLLDPALSVEAAAAYARRARGPRGRPAGGWASLTSAEQEVVRLAVAGLTNPQIGARLYMSRSTVKTHLSHVYGKLGVANRTELAAAAAGHQMLELGAERGGSTSRTTGTAKA